MSLEQTMVLIFGSAINAVCLSIFPLFIFFVVKYPPFRFWIMKMVEDGDGIPHKADAKDALILFFAGLLCWVLINIIFMQVFFNRDFLVLIGVVSGIVFVLFGISKVGQK
jgi:hypothetical protein